MAAVRSGKWSCCTVIVNAEQNSNDSFHRTHGRTVAALDLFNGLYSIKRHINGKFSERDQAQQTRASRGCTEYVNVFSGPEAGIAHVYLSEAPDPNTQIAKSCRITGHAVRP
jgi:hypothetical protein